METMKIGKVEIDYKSPCRFDVLVYNDGGDKVAVIETGGDNTASSFIKELVAILEAGIAARNAKRGEAEHIVMGKPDCLDGHEHEYVSTKLYPKNHVMMQCIHCGCQRTCAAEGIAQALCS